jgi:hypothetical protein
MAFSLVNLISREKGNNIWKEVGNWNYPKAVLMGNLAYPKPKTVGNLHYPNWLFSGEL